VIRKTVRVVGIAALVLILIVVTGLGVLAWRLYRGPIDADFAVRYVKQGLSGAGSAVSIKLGKTQVVWAAGSGGVRLRSKNLQIYDRGGREIARFPEVSIGVSPASLLVGRLRLQSIRLLQPEIALVRNPKGGVKLSGQGSRSSGQGRFLSTLLDRMSEAPDEGTLISALQAIEIVGGKVTLSDPATRQVWRANRLHAVFSRGTRGIAGKLSFDLLIGDKPVRFAADALYQKNTGAIRATLSFTRLDPSVFATARGTLAALANLRMPLSGKISFNGKDDGRIESGTVDVEGSEGWIKAPGVYAQPLRVNAVLVTADIKAGGQAAEIRRFWVDLGESTLALNGTVKGRDGRFSFDGGASLTEFSLSSLSNLWPSLASRNGRLWVDQNVRGGRVQYLDVDFRLSIDTGQAEPVRLDRLAGSFEYRGLTVSYFGSLPPVRDVDGTATFDPKELRFTIKRGLINRSRLSAASVRIHDFDKPIQSIAIAGNIDGPMADILRIVDRKPLGFAKKLGVNPAAIGGQASVRLTVSFPLLTKLTFDSVAIVAQTRIRNLSWRKALFGLDLTKGQFQLRVDKDGFELDGKTLLAGSPSQLRWQEKFGPKSDAWRRRLAIKGSYTPKALLGAGIDMRWFMSGPFGADIKVSAFDDGRTLIDGTYDFRRNRFTVPVLNIVKPPGMPARGTSLLVVRGLRLAEVSRFTLQAPVISAAGKATFMRDGQTLRRLVIQRLVAGRSRLSATITSRGKAGRSIRLAGKSLDLVPMLKGSGDQKKPGAARSAPQPLSINAKVDRLFVTKDMSFRSVAGSARHNGTAFESVRMKAALPSGRSLNLDLQGDQRRQTITLRSEDGGGALQALGIVKALRGGRLLVRALRRPEAKGSPMSGTVRLEKFRIVQAPSLARFFAAAERRRIDKSIDMQRLDLSFDLIGDRFRIRGGQAYSAQIGVTASGQIDRKKGDVRIRGTFVPLYALNSVFGKIPLFGRLLVGEKGSGLFAAHFTVSGSLEAPRFNVNPISILTPGVIRRIFDIGSGVEDPFGESGTGKSKGQRRQVRPKGPDR